MINVKDFGAVPGDEDVTEMIRAAIKTAVNFPLSKFLHDRIAEDEIEAQYRQSRWDYTINLEGESYATRFDSPESIKRAVAECKAKIWIASDHGPCKWNVDVGLPKGTPYCKTCGGRYSAEEWPCSTFRTLALPYADHPDYQQEWKP